NRSSSGARWQPCKVLAWKTASFNPMVEILPSLQKNLDVILRSRLEELSRRFCEVSTKATSPRLAIALISLVDRIGEKVEGHIELRVSQQTLGQMTGMTPNSVWNLLSIWKGQGIVKLRREVVEIHDLPHLLNCTELVHTSALHTGAGDEVVASGTTIADINKRSHEGPSSY